MKSAEAVDLLCWHKPLDSRENSNRICRHVIGTLRCPLVNGVQFRTSKYTIIYVSVKWSSVWQSCGGQRSCLRCFYFGGWFASVKGCYVKNTSRMLLCFCLFGLKIVSETWKMTVSNDTFVALFYTWIVVKGNMCESLWLVVYNIDLQGTEGWHAMCPADMCMLAWTVFIIVVLLLFVYL